MYPVHTVSWCYIHQLWNSTCLCILYLLFSHPNIESYQWTFCPGPLQTRKTSQCTYVVAQGSFQVTSPSTCLDEWRSSISHRPPLRKSASLHCCCHGNTWPAHAAAPGPPGNLPSRAPGWGSLGPRGGCRRCWHLGKARSATGRAPAPTGGKSGRVRRRPQGLWLHRWGGVTQ